MRKCSRVERPWGWEYWFRGGDINWRQKSGEGPDDIQEVISILDVKDFHLQQMKATVLTEILRYS